MDIQDVNKLCANLGGVIQYDESPDFFGNIELVFMTPYKTEIHIISDREEFVCYIKKKYFQKRMVSLNYYLYTTELINFDSLKAAIKFLESHIQMIEKK